MTEKQREDYLKILKMESKWWYVSIKTPPLSGRKEPSK